MISIICHRAKTKKILIKSAIILFWLLVWQLVSTFVNQEILIVSPVRVFQRILELAAEAKFWEITLWSFIRITIGFTAALAVGILLGAITAKFRIIHDLFQPIISLIKATPVTSFIMLAFVWISPTGYITTFISFLIVLPVIWANVFEGIKNTDKNLLEMAEIMSVGKWKILLKIYTPSVKPYLTAACSVAYAMAWKAGIAAEVITRPQLSIGREMYYSKIYIETQDLFAWTMIAIIISVIFEKILLRFLKKGDIRKSKKMRVKAISEVSGV